MDDIDLQAPSWRAKLAKANINITNIDYDHMMVFFDFSYRPYPGKPQKWMKSCDSLKPGESWSKLADRLCGLVLELRKELEG